MPRPRVIVVGRPEGDVDRLAAAEITDQPDQAGAQVVGRGTTHVAFSLDRDRVVLDVYRGDCAFLVLGHGGGQRVPVGVGPESELC